MADLKRKEVLPLQENSPKKNRLSGEQKFRQEYSKAYPGILKSWKGPKYARCTACACDFSISHGGEYDVKKHLKTSKHQQNMSLSQGSGKINTFFVKSDSKTENAVINAECLFTSLLVEHNMPIAVADHATKIFPKMFPDSDIAKKYACSGTKTTAIVREMAATATMETVSNLKSKVFSLSTDGSNDVDSKLYPIVVSYFDDNEGKVVNRLLCNPNLVGKSTGENIAELLNKELSQKGLKWEHVISLGVDNANVMIGRKKGLTGHSLKLNPEIIIRGCPCHLLHLAAEKASKILHYQFDEILIDIYFYLDKSANRKQELTEFQNLCDVEVQSVLKHVCTRWLSLGKCLQRLIDQWIPLKMYFTSKHEEKKKKGDKNKSKEKRQSELPNTKTSERGVEPQSTSGLDQAKDSSAQRSSPANTYLREERLYRLLTSRRCAVYAVFLNNCIQVFDRYNIKLQSEQPLIHTLRRILLSLYKELLSRFIKPRVIANSSDVLDVDFKDSTNILKNDELVIGYEVGPFLQKLDNDNKAAFFEDVKSYYQTALDYMKLKFSLTDETLKHAEIADVSKRNEDKVSMKSVEYFAVKFKPILVEESITWTDTMNCLHRQFLAYKADTLSNVNLSDPINKVWSEICLQKDAMGQFKYDRLSLLMKSILVIPHSNAGCERVFSLVRKNRTDFRCSMSDDTLEAIVIRKQEMAGRPCHSQLFTADFLKRAKTATYRSLSTCT